MTRTINIAVDYTDTPGARYIADGPFSGEHFRETVLVPLFENLNSTDKVVIILDGVEGFATSFLEEAFGGLARKITPEKVLNHLELVSAEDRYLVAEIHNYINAAKVQS
ncbi:MAG: STAS-like domain-containing protein [Leptospirales bacterium]|nr:STAS-like domain-containing protein [Leptospirales bacterium]